MKKITPTTTTRSFGTSRELLASLHNDRSGTLQSLTTAPFRITSDPVDIRGFWQLFDDSVHVDGTVDVNAFVSPSSGTVMSARDPVTIGLAITVIGVLVTVFTAGYAVGKDMADTDDADDEAAAASSVTRGADDGSSDRLGERSTITVEPGRHSIKVRVSTAPATAGPTDISAQELLAELRKNRAGTLQRLRKRREWRVVMAPIPTEDVWAFIDSSVSPDGSISVRAPEPADVNRIAPVKPMAFGTVEVLVALVVLTIAVFVLGVGIGYIANDNDDPGSEDETETTNDGDTAQGGDVGGAGGLIGTPMLRLGEFGAVDLTVRLAPAEAQPTTPR